MRFSRHFFAALTHKHDAIPVQPYAPHSAPSRSLARTGLEALGKQERGQVIEHLLQTFGFNLCAVLEQQALALWQWEQYIYAIPELFISRFADLPREAIGMLVGIWGKQGFVPSHELVARFVPRFSGGRMALSNEQVDIWLAGQDLRGADAPYPAGAVVLLEDGKGRFVGRGKVLGKRIRDLLHQRWVY